MLLKYAAGSRFGSGARGKVTSGREGEPKDCPFRCRAEKGDLSPAELLALLDVVDSLSVVETLELFRLKRPMLLMVVQLQSRTGREVVFAEGYREDLRT